MRAKLLAGLFALTMAAGALVVPVAQAVDFCGPDAEVALVTQGQCQQWNYSFEVNPNNPSQHNPLAYNDAAGPAGQEEQNIPPETYIPSEFVGLPQLLVKPALDSGSVKGDAPSWVQKWTGFNSNTHAVLDQTVLTESEGHSVPIGYLGAQTLGHSWTTPAAEVFAFYGFWNDLNGNGIIDSPSCNNPSFCNPAQDEFVWRGSNTGESLNAYMWVFPTNAKYGAPAALYVGDGGATGGLGGDGPSYVGLVAVGAGMAGDCQRYAQYDKDCTSPAPSGLWSDRSNVSNSAQEWVGGGSGIFITGSGFPEVTPEETLLIDRYVVSVFGPSNLTTPTDPYVFSPNADQASGGTGPMGYFRDSDWFQALAPSAVSNLYGTEMRFVRDQSQNVLSTPLPPPVVSVLSAVNNATSATNSASDTVSYGCNVPGAVKACNRDVRQILATNNNANVQTQTAGAPKSQARPFIEARFDSEVPTAANTPPRAFYNYECYTQANLPAGTCDATTAVPGGVYGQNGVSGPFQAGGAYLTGFVGPTLYIRASMDAWIWYDNGDGFIGAPDNYTIAQYNSGNFSSANTDCMTVEGGQTSCGAIAPSGPGNDTVVGLTPELVGQGTTVTPVGGNWPPGSFEVYYMDDNPYCTQPVGPGPSQCASLVPLTGDTAAFLEADTGSSFCPTGATSGCPSENGLLLPEGDALGLHGVYQASLSWNEGSGANAAQYAWAGTYTWDQSV
ncbi:MAG: hypothetical protein ACYDDF_09595 [Thermoplasmatota archaeon]